MGGSARRRARRTTCGRGCCACCTTGRSSTTRRASGASRATAPGSASRSSRARASWPARRSPAGALATVSSTRIGNELRLALAEPDPVAALESAVELGLAPWLEVDRAAVERALGVLGDAGDPALTVLATVGRDVPDVGLTAAWRRTLDAAAALRAVDLAGAPPSVADRAFGTAPAEAVAATGTPEARRWLAQDRASPARDHRRGPHRRRGAARSRARRPPAGGPGRAAGRARRRGRRGPDRRRPSIAGVIEWDGDHLTARLGDARVLFTTRHGGVSQGPFASLNLGERTGDDPEARRGQPRPPA